MIAHPGLLDPNFRRTVLFISTHDAEGGSFGMVLNRPAGRTVGELLPDRETSPLGSVPVLLGGPVGRDQLTFASFAWSMQAGTMLCRTHLDIEEAERMVREEDEVIVRAFVGYAGWSKAQLEGEMAQKAWLLKRPDARALECLVPDRAEVVWREMTGSFGPWFRLVADAPEDASRN